jgi:hypothetical protein
MVFGYLGEKLLSQCEKSYGIENFRSLIRVKLIPVVARSKLWVCGRRSPAEIVGSNLARVMDVVCCECCLLSGRGFCDELITRPESSPTDCGALYVIYKPQE